ncbi:Hda2p KNAG_0M01630 [Huiozyma naganishii CBS 8797]|uniref:HDA1 complex subunit 2 n=1 Tax=Huiozyma naganishii (strain ATCC MYA-139 / BCRC 22969 / CBS 8797 / KCTC 17520 / NBRC 10181 / NCYC 3082 / Yp74L-3) TaxID=1071383 RepID=J7SBG1_HUIN7|nr:hypothetical protein KNAG_0M01630 [Kazachstania naganishii CBS 8797]CCK73016.1 hypothetical protein KNAG_0M01630 [Kazachstania naganishii CBS 8797]
MANTHYLSVTLSEFQKDLVEILVAMHQKNLQTELYGLKDDQSAAAASKSQLSQHQHYAYPQLSSTQMTYMFDSHIRNLANHPCLLVDHYMPRQFLKMEPIARLIQSSGKFNVLQHLLSVLTNTTGTDSRPLKIALVAHSIKELDILEGLLLGQQFRLKRLSGTSLCDEGHVFVRQNDLSEGTDTGTMGTVGSNATGPMGDSSTSSSNKSPQASSSIYTRDDYHYDKTSRAAGDTDSRNWLFLATTKHLLHNESLLQQYDTDLILAFDPLLDTTLKSIPVLPSGNTIPIVKLLVRDSPDHYIMAKGLANSTNDHELDYKILKESLQYFLRYRKVDSSANDDIDYKRFISDVLSASDDKHCDLPLRVDDELTDGDITAPQFYTDFGTRKDIVASNTVFNVKNYQRELMQRTMDRLQDINTQFHSNKEKLVTRQLLETERQNKLDFLKHDGVGVNFKSLEALQKEQLDSEKRLERVTAEHEKLGRRREKLMEQVTALKRLRADAHDPFKLQGKITEFKEQIAKQKQERNQLLEKNFSLNSRSNELRSDYQQKSADAAARSLELASLKKTQEEALKRKNGPLASQLNYLALVQTQASLRDEASQWAEENSFLSQYTKKLNELYETKHTTKKPVKQSKRGSGRYRSTRSTSPSYV